MIARRYRPQGFDQVIGQDAIVRTLRNAITSGRIAHGYIFSGHRGIGKTSVARVLAKALNCRAGDGPTPTPCQHCLSCTEIAAGNAIDVIEIDAASNRGIDEIRALRERVRYRPARDRFKFFILDEAHQLTADAFNALLKTLEEPPEWVVFVLATTEPDALPATIRSRCQQFAFRAVSFPLLLDRLREICAAEHVAADSEALELIAAAGDGSVRDALSLLEQAIAYSGDSLQPQPIRALLGRVAAAQIRDLLLPLRDGRSGPLLQQADALLATGVGPAPLCAQLTQTIRNALVAQAAPALPDLIAAGLAERALALELASAFREEDLARFLQILLRTAADLRHGQQQRLHFELALIKMLHARKLASLEDVLAALQGQPGAPPPPGPKTLTAPLPAGAQPQQSPPPVAPSSTPNPDPSAAVRAVLERQGKASLLTMLAAAAWHWSAPPEPRRLELAYAPGDAHALLLQQPAALKSLAAACLEALGFAPDISVLSAASVSPSASAPAPPPLPGSPEDRADHHPFLRQLRLQVPLHVLRTRALPPREANPVPEGHSS
ncbi:MAG: DNA polymerase III subunit gamma/tau [Terriglobales bacterium]